MDDLSGRLGARHRRLSILGVRFLPGLIFVPILNVRNLRFGLAEGPTFLRAIHRLRHDVYVREFRFFDPVLYPDGILADEFDGMGMHAVAAQGEDVVAALRLALHSERGFPLQGVIPEFKAPKPPEQTGEVSHLVIAKAFRRRREDGLYGAESYLKIAQGGILPNAGPLSDHMKKRWGPLLTLGLFKVLYQHSRRLGLESWLMLAERSLYQVLNRYGLPFRQVADPLGGPEGPRPCLLLLNDLEKSLRLFDPRLFAEFTDGLEREYRP
ncbi:MAG: GNAT family N-acetyltransferase [Elusimicrobia bacterium]|nr:GNAT family N-acetyltransferase [Elusimicrobiota bacterium]